MPVVEAMLAFAGQHVGGHLCHITKGERGEFVVFSNGQRQLSFALGLRCIKQEVFGVEARSETRSILFKFHRYFISILLTE